MKEVSSAEEKVDSSFTVQVPEKEEIGMNRRILLSSVFPSWAVELKVKEKEYALPTEMASKIGEGVNSH